MTESPLANFLGHDCTGCGRTKHAQQSFCKTCYYALPLDTRQSLYLRMGYGYEAAFAEAQKLLQEKNAGKSGDLNFEGEASR